MCSFEIKNTTSIWGNIFGHTIKNHNQCFFPEKMNICRYKCSIEIMLIYSYKELLKVTNENWKMIKIKHVSRLSIIILFIMSKRVIFNEFMN